MQGNLSEEMYAALRRNLIDGLSRHHHGLLSQREIASRVNELTSRELQVLVWAFTRSESDCLRARQIRKPASLDSSTLSRGA